MDTVHHDVLPVHSNSGVKKTFSWSSIVKVVGVAFFLTLGYYSLGVTGSGFPSSDREVTSKEFPGSASLAVQSAPLRSMLQSSPADAEGQKDKISLSREGGQYYIVYEGMKHSMASSEFAYFDLSVTDINKAVPDTEILRLPEADPFNELDETEKKNLKKIFLAENEYGLKALPGGSPDNNYK